MVYNLTSNLFDVLGQIAHLETSTRTDGTTPLLDRVCDAIFNLDRQPNKTSITLPSIPTRVFYVTVEYYTIYYFHNGVDACIIQVDVKNSRYNLRTNQAITTSVDYSSLVSRYKPYMTSHYDYYPYVFVKRKGRGGKFNLRQDLNNGTQEIMFDIDFDEIIPFNQYDNGYYGKGYLYGDKGWYKLFTNHNYEYHDEKESNDLDEQRHKRVVITESQLQEIIQEAIKRILRA